MLPRRTYGEHSEPKITRMFCFEMTQLPASRLRRFTGARAARENARRECTVAVPYETKGGSGLLVRDDIATSSA